MGAGLSKASANGEGRRSVSSQGVACDLAVGEEQQL